VALRDPLDDCVHCGFCLPACPTYVSWGEEMDSPRGRIDLMRGLSARKIPLDDTVVTHFDRCLGCMACVTACPSGVRYDVLIEQTRATVEHNHHRTIGDRLFRAVLFALFPHPRRLRLLLVFAFAYARSGLAALARRSGLTRLLPPRLRQIEALLPPLRARQLAARLPRATPAAGERRGRVALLAGCVQRLLFPDVNQATLRVLAADGYEALVPPGQGCCGALSLHAGREDEARRLTRALIAHFEDGDLDAVVVNAAGCGSHLKTCARLFAGDPAWQERAARFAARVRDVSELLAAQPPRAPRHPLPVRVAYHDACHLAHAQGIREQPRRLLRAIPGLELAEIADADQCCGSAGIYNLIQPEAADQIGRRKVAAVQAAAAPLLASANPGCSLHLAKLLREQGLSLRAVHPIELLDASIRGLDAASLVRR
jgi:glycolate oxidase iron-sulfur subunit